MEIRSLDTLRGLFFELLTEERPVAVHELAETDGRPAEVRRWAKRWHLSAEWVVDYAVDRMREWSELWQPKGGTPELWLDIFADGDASGHEWSAPPEPAELTIRWDPALPPGVHDLIRVPAQRRRGTHPDPHAPDVVVTARAEHWKAVVGGGSVKSAQKAIADAAERYTSAEMYRLRRSGFGRPIAYQPGKAGRHPTLPVALRLRAVIWRCCGFPGQASPPDQPPSWAMLANRLAKHQGSGTEIPRQTAEGAVKRMAKKLELRLP